MENANVARFLSLQAEVQPQACAVKVPVGRAREERIVYRERTFGELDRDSGATATFLSDRGIHRGMRTLVMVKPGLDLIRVIFALFRIGAVPVVIDPGMGLGNFLSCVRRTQPAAVVGIPIATALSRIFRSTFKATGVRIRIDASLEGKIHGRPSLGAVEAEGKELAAILFTSGSTGAPKGVLYEHGMFDAQVRLIGSRFGIQPGEVDLPMLPVFALFNPAFGMTTVVPEMNPSRPARVDPAKVVQAILQNKVTNSFGSPAIWSRIARYCERKDVRLPSLRRVLMAGAAVPPELMERFGRVMPNGEIFSPYGATESLPVAAISAKEVLGETRAKTEAGAGTCVGRVLPEMVVRILKSGSVPGVDLEAAPSGEIGEIVVSGPVVTRGYDQLPEATAAAKIVDRGNRLWHRMGDVGYLDDQGRIWFCGRKVECVTTEAGSLYPDCCEAIFNRHPKVFRSALIGFGLGGNQTPAMAIEPEPACYPWGRASRSRFIEELRALGAQFSHTEGILDFYFLRRFPVDVRHNAKIHRLTLARRLGR